MDLRHIVGGVLIGALAGCATSGTGTTDSASPSQAQPSGSAASADVGSLYTSTWNDSTRTIARHPIAADGTLRAPITIADEPADDVDFPGTVDGLGASVLTGSYSEYWTTEVQLRDATSGVVTSKAKAPQWCGGEGLTYNDCTLLDDTLLARTSPLGEEKTTDGTVTVSSLETGEDSKQLGPFPGLFAILGTSDANTLMVLASDSPNTNPPEPSAGTVSAVDVGTGAATEVGAYPAGWSALCAIGVDSVLGYTTSGTPTAVVVGPATIGQVTWSEDESPIGCTSDGSYLYLQKVSQPPTEENDDSDSAAPGAATAVTRISLVDGSREQVLTLDAGSYADLVTR